MLDWIISLTVATLFVGLGFYANSKLGTVRKDARPHQVPWGLVMVLCVFVVFMVLVHLANLAGVETGPENSPFGRF
ncbi:MAG: hypothetical protein QNI84_16985 [Henriciella sp.]|nr:hypothetical protein [Henriciella sp.]